MDGPLGTDSAHRTSTTVPPVPGVHLNSNLKFHVTDGRIQRSVIAIEQAFSCRTAFPLHWRLDPNVLERERESAQLVGSVRPNGT